MSVCGDLRSTRGGLLLLLCSLIVIPWLAGQGRLQLQGLDYLELREVGAGLGMEAHAADGGDSLRLHSEWSELVFRPGSREAAFNGLRVFLGWPVREARGRLWIAESDYEHTVRPLLSPQTFAPFPTVRRILLDPGHGGRDPGTSHPGLKLFEKHLTLDLARRLARLLEEEGYEVVFTREDDRYVDLTERSLMAGRVDADLFLSLHFNAAGNDRVEGVETYVLPPLGQPSSARTSLHASDRRLYRGNAHDPWNALLGYLVHRELTGLPRAQDRGLRRARFTVLLGLDCPGILLEGGFVTHDREGRDIGSAGYRQAMAEAIAAGVLAYARRTAASRP
ncbi:MAG: N-acetylmuramoyl-L-alanine amidase [Opitutales bacterium]